MDTTLEQGLASAVRYIQDNIDSGTKIYFEDLPESFYVPSIYFPVPATAGDFATLQSRCVEHTVECWFMASNNWDAYMAANKVVEQIMLDSCLIPIVEQDGSKAGKCLGISKPKTRKIDDGIISLSFTLKEYFRAEDSQTAPKVNKVIIAEKTK